VNEPPVVFVATSGDGAGQCDGSYTGIGVMAGRNGEVWEVAPGGPAARAVILAGDVIENIDILSPNSMPEGAQVVLFVRRGAVTTPKMLTIGRVCYS
jgi:C-terminal processing protease CtpA/Prc